MPDWQNRRCPTNDFIIRIFAGTLELTGAWFYLFLVAAYILQFYCKKFENECKYIVRS